MIGSSPFKGYGYIDTTNHTPEQLEKYAKNVALRRKAGLEDDGYFFVVVVVVFCFLLLFFFNRPKGI